MATKAQVWRERIDALEAEVNEGRTVTDEGYVVGDRSRLIFIVMERWTLRTTGETYLKVGMGGDHDNGPCEYMDILALGELADAQPGDYLRMIFAIDEAE